MLFKVSVVLKVDENCDANIIDLRLVIGLGRVWLSACVTGGHETWEATASAHRVYTDCFPLNWTQTRQGVIKQST